MALEPNVSEMNRMLVKSYFITMHFYICLHALVCNNAFTFKFALLCIFPF